MSNTKKALIVIVVLLLAAELGTLIGRAETTYKPGQYRCNAVRCAVYSATDTKSVLEAGGFLFEGTPVNVTLTGKATLKSKVLWIFSKTVKNANVGKAEAGLGKTEIYIDLGQFEPQ